MPFYDSSKPKDGEAGLTSWISCYELVRLCLGYCS